MKKTIILAVLVTILLSLPVATTGPTAVVPQAQAIDSPLSCVTWELDGGDAWLRFCLHDLQRQEDTEFIW